MKARKALALLLSLCMIIGMFPTMALATYVDPGNLAGELEIAADTGAISLDDNAQNLSATVLAKSKIYVVSASLENKVDEANKARNTVEGQLAALASEVTLNTPGAVTAANNGQYLAVLTYDKITTPGDGSGDTLQSILQLQITNVTYVPESNLTISRDGTTVALPSSSPAPASLANAKFYVLTTGKYSTLLDSVKAVTNPLKAGGTRNAAETAISVAAVGGGSGTLTTPLTANDNGKKLLTVVYDGGNVESIYVQDIADISAAGSTIYYGWLNGVALGGDVGKAGAVDDATPTALTVTPPSDVADAADYTLTLLSGSSSDNLYYSVAAAAVTDANVSEQSYTVMNYKEKTVSDPNLGTLYVYEAPIKQALVATNGRIYIKAGSTYYQIQVGSANVNGLLASKDSTGVAVELTAKEAKYGYDVTYYYANLAEMASDVSTYANATDLKAKLLGNIADEAFAFPAIAADEMTLDLNGHSMNKTGGANITMNQNGKTLTIVNTAQVSGETGRGVISTTTSGAAIAITSGAVVLDGKIDVKGGVTVAGTASEASGLTVGADATVSGSGVTNPEATGIAVSGGNTGKITVNVSGSVTGGKNMTAITAKDNTDDAGTTIVNIKSGAKISGGVANTTGEAGIVIGDGNNTDYAVVNVADGATVTGTVTTTTGSNPTTTYDQPAVVQHGGTLNVAGGTFDGASGIVTGGGTLAITGAAEINAHGENSDSPTFPADQAGAMTAAGGIGILVIGSSSGTKNLDMEISGGPTVTSEKGYAIRELAGTGTALAKLRIYSTAGTYTGLSTLDNNAFSAVKAEATNITISSGIFSSNPAVIKNTSAGTTKASGFLSAGFSAYTNSAADKAAAQAAGATVNPPDGYWQVAAGSVNADLTGLYINGVSVDLTEAGTEAGDLAHPVNLGSVSVLDQGSNNLYLYATTNLATGVKAAPVLKGQINNQTSFSGTAITIDTGLESGEPPLAGTTGQVITNDAFSSGNIKKNYVLLEVTASDGVTKKYFYVAVSYSANDTGLKSIMGLDLETAKVKDAATAKDTTGAAVTGVKLASAFVTGAEDGTIAHPIAITVTLSTPKALQVSKDSFVQKDESGSVEFFGRNAKFGGSAGVNTLNSGTPQYDDTQNTKVNLKMDYVTPGVGDTVYVRVKSAAGLYAYYAVTFVLKSNDPSITKLQVNSKNNLILIDADDDKAAVLSENEGLTLAKPYEFDLTDMTMADLLASPTDLELKITTATDAGTTGAYALTAEEDEPVTDRLFTSGTQLMGSGTWAAKTVNTDTLSGIFTPNAGTGVYEPTNDRSQLYIRVTAEDGITYGYYLLKLGTVRKATGDGFITELSAGKDAAKITATAAYGTSQNEYPSVNAETAVATTKDTAIGTDNNSGYTLRLANIPNGAVGAADATTGPLTLTIKTNFASGLGAQITDPASKSVLNSTIDTISYENGYSEVDGEQVLDSRIYTVTFNAYNYSTHPDVYIWTFAEDDSTQVVASAAAYYKLSVTVSSTLDSDATLSAITLTPNVTPVTNTADAIDAAALLVSGKTGSSANPYTANVTLDYADLATSEGDTADKLDLSVVSTSKKAKAVYYALGTKGQAAGDVVTTSSERLLAGTDGEFTKADVGTNYFTTDSGKSLYLLVIPQTGTEKYYVINITVNDADDTKTLSHLKYRLSGEDEDVEVPLSEGKIAATGLPEGVKRDGDYAVTVTLPYGTAYSNAEIKAQAASDLAWVQIGSNAAVQGAATQVVGLTNNAGDVTVTVRTQDKGTSQRYTITFKRGTADGNMNALGSYTYQAKGVASGKTLEKNLTTTKQGLANTETVLIKVPTNACQANDVVTLTLSPEVASSKITKGSGDVTVNTTTGAATVTLKLATQSLDSNYKDSGDASALYSTDATVVVTAENGSKTTYTISAYMANSTSANTDLDPTGGITFTPQGGTAVTYDATDASMTDGTVNSVETRTVLLLNDRSNYSTVLAAESGSIAVKVTPKDANAKVSRLVNNTVVEGNEFTVDTTYGNGSQTFTVTAENGTTTQEYTIVFCSSSIKQASANSPVMLEAISGAAATAALESAKTVTVYPATSTASSLSLGMMKDAVNAVKALSLKISGQFADVTLNNTNLTALYAQMGTATSVTTIDVTDIATNGYTGYPTAREFVRAVNVTFKDSTGEKMSVASNHEYFSSNIVVKFKSPITTAARTDALTLYGVTTAKAIDFTAPATTKLQSASAASVDTDGILTMSFKNVNGDIVAAKTVDSYTVSFTVTDSSSSPASAISTVGYVTTSDGVNITTSGPTDVTYNAADGNSMTFTITQLQPATKTVRSVNYTAPGGSPKAIYPNAQGVYTVPLAKVNGNTTTGVAIVYDDSRVVTKTPATNGSYELGNVTTVNNVTYAADLATVLVTVTPDSGREMKALSVINSDTLTPITATAVTGETNVYSFTMPNEHGATVSVSFNDAVYSMSYTGANGTCTLYADAALTTPADNTKLSGSGTYYLKLTPADDYILTALKANNKNMTFAASEDGTYYTATLKVEDFASADSTAIAVAATFTAKGTVATPAFSPAADTYTEAQTVTITCATDGASIYYTTNGDTPTANSTLYTTAGITVSENATIKAIAIKDGMTNSEVATAAYVIDTSASEGKETVTDTVTPTNGKATVNTLSDVGEKTEQVNVKATSSDTAQETKEAADTAVTLSDNVIGQIASANDGNGANLSLATDAATVELPAEAVKTIDTAAGTKAKVSIVKESKAAAEKDYRTKVPASVAGEVQGAVKVDVIANDSDPVEIKELTTTPIKITTYIAKGLDKNTVKVLYDDHGTVKVDENVKVESYDPAAGKLVFTTTHLSGFVAVGLEAAPEALAIVAKFNSSTNRYDLSLTGTRSGCQYRLQVGENRVSGGPNMSDISAAANEVVSVLEYKDSTGSIYDADGALIGYTNRGASVDWSTVSES